LRFAEPKLAEMDLYIFKQAPVDGIRFAIMAA
jgi:hypothetical protein